MRVGFVLVGALIAGVAGIMFWVSQGGGDCPGGTEIRTQRACLDTGRSQAQCAALFAQAHATLARTGPVSDTREQCERQYSTCQPSTTVTGFVPMATGLCIAPGSTDRIVPRFTRQGG